MKRTDATKCCGTCRFAQFALTPTGRIKKHAPARCGYPVQQIELPPVPQCVSLTVGTPKGIWESAYPDCATYERYTGMILAFTPLGVCTNCLNGAHDICQGCKCESRGHRQWWWRDDGITNEEEALRATVEGANVRR
jgi:hypothetical protein